MPTEPNLFDQTGRLVRAGGGFALLPDGGGKLRLELSRVPVNEVGKRVRVIGRMLEGDLIEVEGVRLA